MDKALVPLEAHIMSKCPDAKVGCTNFKLVFFYYCSDILGDTCLKAWAVLWNSLPAHAELTRTMLTLIRTASKSSSYLQ